MKEMIRQANYVLWFRFLMPYIIFIVIFLAIAYSLYYRTLSLVEHEVTDYNMSILDQTQQVLNNRLKEVDIFGQKLINDSKVIRFQYSDNPMQGAEMFKVMDTIKRLYEYKLPNLFFDQYFILYKSSNLVLGTDNAYSMREFYDTVLTYENVAFETWRDTVVGSYHHRTYLPAAPVIYKGEQTSMLTFIKSLGYPGYFQGAAVILIREQVIKELLSRLDVSEGGWTYIADEDGNIITYRAMSDTQIQPILLPKDHLQGVTEQNINGTDMLVTYKKSEYNGWMYVAVQPSHIILNKVLYIKKTTINLFLVYLIVVLSLALLLAYRSSKPVQNLISKISDHFGQDYPKNRDVYRFLNASISSIIYNYEDLREKAKTQFPLLRAVLFEQLLKGHVLDEDIIRSHSEHIGLKLYDGKYTVAVLNIKSGDSEEKNPQKIFEEVSVKKVVLQETVENVLDEYMFIHDTGEDNLVIMLGCKTLNSIMYKQEFLMKLQEVERILRNDYEIQITIAVGSFYDKLTELSRSYEEAKQVLAYLSKIGREHVLFHEDMPEKGNEYFYPGDIEIRLMNLSKTGAADQVQALLDELKKKNFSDLTLSPSMLRLFVFDVWGSLIKTMAQTSASDEFEMEHINALIKQIDSYAEIELVYNEISQAFLTMCRTASCRKKSHNKELLDRVVGWIHASFHKEALTLFQIADELQMSEVYLSNFFKEQMGETFTAYLERVRMEQAVELLTTTETPINKIAERVGYSSSNTFGRAFKRIYGVSAVYYRNTNKFDYPASSG